MNDVKHQKSVLDLRLSYTEGIFDCYERGLTSLVGSPRTVTESFYCGANYLTSLEGGPVRVGKGYYASDNQLTSLIGAPTKVGASFYCHYNQLTSLEGAPTSVGGGFYCSDNRLTSLEGAPTSVGGHFYCSDNRLTSLKSIHRIIHQISGTFNCYSNPIKEGYLYLLLIKGLIGVSSNFTAADDIVNEYLENNPSGSMKAVLEVQALLEEANVQYPR